MINKKGFLPRDFFIAVTIFVGVVGIFSLMVVGVSQNYPQTNIVDPTFQQRYNAAMAQQANWTEIIRNSTLSNEGLTFQGAFNVAFGSTFTAIRIIFSSLSSFSLIVSSITNDLTGLNFDPNIILAAVGIFITVITIILLFVWLSSVMRGRI